MKWKVRSEVPETFFVVRHFTTFLPLNWVCKSYTSGNGFPKNGLRFAQFLELMQTSCLAIFFAELHFCKIGFHVSDNLRRKACECLSPWISFDGYFSGKSHVNSDYMPASIQAFVFRLFSSQFSHTHEVPGKNRWGKNFLKQSFCILTKLLMENGREGSWTGAIYILLIVCQFPQKREKLSIIVYWHAMRCGFEKFQEENQTFVWRLK